MMLSCSIKAFFSSFLLLFVSLHAHEKAPEGYCGAFHFDVSEKDQKTIHEMISTIANTSSIGLAFKQGYVKGLGRQIEHVPPLQFLAAIFGNPELAKDMVKMQSSSMKYTPFVEGLKKNLYLQYRENCIEEQVSGFAEYLKVDPQKVQELIDVCAKNCSEEQEDSCFRPFVDYLVEEKGKKNH